MRLVTIPNRKKGCPPGHAPIHTSSKRAQGSKILVLAAGSIFLCWFLVIRHGIFGSEVDWISQHSVFPDYFRKRFYETGYFFPDIAWNLGGGQNIYNFSYYGLWNPVLMLSWLLPFVPMDCYIMVTSILCYACSVVLFYLWLDKKGLPETIRFGCAVMFELAAPMIYHSYNQLMFVNYMPFLCLALMGTDRYFDSGKRGLLIGGTLGMILTSFYFSVGGIVALGLYALSRSIDCEKTSVCDCPEGEAASARSGEVKEETEEKQRCQVRTLQASGRSLKKKGSAIIGKMPGFAGCILHAVLLAGVLLVPTAYAIFSGRQGSGSFRTEVGQFFSLPLDRIIYSPHGLGLSTLIIAAVTGSIFYAKKWTNRVLPAGLLAIISVSAVGYLLNGGLYMKNKVFIPFLPLMCLQTGIYLKEETGFANKMKGLLPYIITIVWILLQKNSAYAGKYGILLMLDCVVMGVLYLVRIRFPKIPWALYASCIFLFCYGCLMNAQTAHMIPTEEYQATRKRQEEPAVSRVLEEDTDWYRFDQVGDGRENKEDINRISDIRQNITSLYSSGYHEMYRQFRNRIFQLNEPFRNNMMQSATDNPCFLQFMGVRYLRAAKAPDGYVYETACENSENAIYKNENAAPVIYATDQVIGETSYYKMTFPQNQTTLVQRAVVPDEMLEEETAGKEEIGDGVGEKQDTDSETALKETLRTMKPCAFSLPSMQTETFSITPCDGGYEICAKEEAELLVEIPNLDAADTMLALRFDVENERPNKDMHIRVEGQTNRLTAESHEYANYNTDFTYMVTLPKNVDSRQREKNEDSQPGASEAAQTEEVSMSDTKGDMTSQEEKRAGTVAIKFGAGKYRIRNLQAFSGSMQELRSDNLYKDTFQIDSEQSGDDQIVGRMEVESDRYLITSIPYDENFTVLIDGKKAETCKVNTAFLGVKITAGSHEIVIAYHAPGKTAGIWMTVLGILLLGVGKWMDAGGTKEERFYIGKATRAPKSRDILRHPGRFIQYRNCIVSYVDVVDVEKDSRYADL